jgi:hypothetical protein
LHSNAQAAHDAEPEQRVDIHCKEIHISFTFSSQVYPAQIGSQNKDLLHISLMAEDPGLQPFHNQPEYDRPE